MAKKVTKLQKRARRDVRMGVDPILDELNRQGRSARRDLRQDRRATRNIYGSLQDTLQPLGGQYDTQAQAIMGDLQSRLGNLNGMFGTQTAEGQAASGLLGNIAAGGVGNLASDRLRNASYQTSMMRQVPMQQADIQRQQVQNYRDFIDSLRQNRLDVKGDMASQYQQRLDELRDQRFQRGLAKDELELRRDIANRDNRRQNRNDRATRNFTEAELTQEQRREETRGDRKAIRPIKGDVGDINDAIALINQQLKEITGNTYDPREYPSERVGQLTDRRQNLKRKRRKKRRKIKTIKKTDNPGY